MKAYLDHVGIAVSDLAASLAFFRDALDLEVAGAEDVTSQRVRAHFLHAGRSSLELLEATAPDSTIAKYVARRGPGLHHVAVEVEGVWRSESVAVKRSIIGAVTGSMGVEVGDVGAARAAPGLRAEPRGAHRGGASITGAASV